MWHCDLLHALIMLVRVTWRLADGIPFLMVNVPGGPINVTINYTAYLSPGGTMLMRGSGLLVLSSQDGASLLFHRLEMLWSCNQAYRGPFTWDTLPLSSRFSLVDALLPVL